MSREEIDSYLAGLDEPKRSTLGELREKIASLVPEAEQCISYGLPAFRLEGRTIAGFGAFKNHLSYFPHSGSILGALAAELEGYARTKSSLHFPVDRALPGELLERLLALRIAEALGGR